MTPEESASRWIDLLAAQRAEHLARLHAFGRQLAGGTVFVAAALVLAVMLGLDPLWDLSFADSELAGELALAAAACFGAAGALFALALHQQRHDRGAAIAALDRAIAALAVGGEPSAVLKDLSERLRAVAPARGETGAPHLPSLLDGRWLGTRTHTKVGLACALLLLAALLVAFALVLAAPPVDGDEYDDGGTPTAAAGVGATRA